MEPVRREIKRVYERAAATASEGGFTVELDGRPVRTPGGALLVLPNRRLANAIAVEWQEQQLTVRPETMPMMALACTAIDRIRHRREEVVVDVVRYAETDLLCHRAAGPPDLQARQSSTWQPLLDWAADAYGAPLEVTSGILAIDQPEPSLAALRRVVGACDDMTLSGLALAVTTSGSLVIGLALISGRLEPAAAFAAAELDETYQIEKWGEDAEATRRRAARRADLDAAARFAGLAGA